MQSFRSKLDRAVTKAREVLHDAQRPVAAANGDHTYDDKFLLAEYLTRTATTALLTPLQELGLDSKALSSLKALNASETVYLALEREHSCEFIETKVTKEDAKTQHVTKVKVGLLKAKVTNKVVHTITKHYWKFAVKYTLVAYAGNNSKVESKRIVLKDEQADTVLITTVKNTPQPKMKVFPVLRVNLNWLLEHLDEQGAVSTFAINRLVKSCRTPRRNSEIDVVFSFMSTLGSFCNSVRDYFVSVLHRIEPSGHGLDLGSLQQAAIVVPVWPLLNRTSSGGVLSADELKQEQGEGTGVILTVEQTNKLLAAQASDISGAVANILKSFPNTTGVIRSAGCVITALFVHMQHICTEYKLAVDYIEDMLRQQLIAAIGKVVTPADFAEYMSYHQRKLLKPQYHPKPYSYAVRRPEHYPEGVLDIQFRPTSGGLPQPIETLVFENTEKQTPMHFALNASTNVHFTGKQYVHAWLTHQFSGQSQGSYELASRARQFSCFILMIGTLAGAGEFAPQHAIILQNKDAMIIPLLMSHLPTAKEFKDSIESLSPEQQRFAKAYRSMQLASTLFALCVVQIKPQLERLLNLPDQSLTKERRLTQQLMTLFTEYQISSDLVKFDGDMKMSKTEKINIVKQQVNTI
jgi:hypothetical protein